MAVIIKIFKWVFIICLFITLISFTSVSFNKDEFSISKIHIDSISQNFITEDILRKYLKDDFSFNSDSTSFDLQLIELALNDNPYIKNNQVFYELSDGVSLDIKTREPILRVLTNDTTFYIIEDCSGMPFSSYFTSRSLIASGNISSIDINDLCELTGFKNIHILDGSSIKQGLYYPTYFLMMHARFIAKKIIINEKKNKNKH